jgi:hypothetical protein
VRGRRLRLRAVRHLKVRDDGEGRHDSRIPAPLALRSKPSRGGRDMIGRIDELIARLFAFFVLPVLNVTIVSLLVHWCVSDEYSVSSLVAKLDIGGVTQYFVNVLGALVSGNVDTIKDLAGRYSSQIATVSNIVAVVMVLTIIIVMVLLDRAIYYVNWIVPLDFDFDAATYGAQHRDDARVRGLYARLAEPFDFVMATGVVRSFLGEHSIDAVRMARRSALSRSQVIARTAFDYAKSYVCLLVIALLFSLFAPILKTASIAVCLAAAAAIACGYLIWYSNAYQALLEFDIDSFIWLRSYNQQDDRFVAASDVTDFGGAAAPIATPRLRDILYLKHQPAGVLYELYVLGRGLVSRFTRRQTRDGA